MPAVVHVGNLTSPETECDLHLVPFGEEFPGCTDLGVKVIGVNVGRETDLLDLHSLLLLLRLFFLPDLFILKLALIHNLAHRWLCGGCDLHQVQTGLLRHSHGLPCGHDAKLLAAFPNQTDLPVPDLFVNH